MAPDFPKFIARVLRNVAALDLYKRGGRIKPLVVRARLFSTKMIHRREQLEDWQRQDIWELDV